MIAPARYWIREANSLGVHQALHFRRICSHGCSVPRFRPVLQQLAAATIRTIFHASEGAALKTARQHSDDDSQNTPKRSQVSGRCCDPILQRIASRDLTGRSFRRCAAARRGACCCCYHHGGCCCFESSSSFASRFCVSLLSRFPSLQPTNEPAHRHCLPSIWQAPREL